MLQLRWPPSGETWHLAERSAAALLDAWLAPDDGATRAELRSALTTDPGLRAWSSRRAAPRRLESLAELEGWWLTSGPEAFDDPASPKATRFSLLALEAECVEHAGRNGAHLAGDSDANCAGLRLLRALPQLEAWRALSTRFDQQLEASRLESLAEFAAAAGHEINNPLGVIVGRAQQLVAEEPDAERRASLAAIRAAAWRVREMIADLMLFARPPEPRMVSQSLAAIVEPLMAELAAPAAARSIRLGCTNTPPNFTAAPPDVRLSADIVQLTIALRAVVMNSIEWAPQGGWVQVSIHVAGAIESPIGNLSTPAAGRWVVVCVADNGPGFTEESRRHAFDPFYSGRQAGRGLGLGLSKAWQIVRAHGGTIRLGQPRTGAEVRIELPLADQERPAERGLPRPAALDPAIDENEL